MAEKGENTRARILDEAVRLASRDGLAGLTIGTLSTSLGLSKSGIFAHFGSKEALQIATLEHAAALVRARSAGLASVPPGAERVRIHFRTLLDWIDDPSRPGGCPITGACIEFDDLEGPVREALVDLQHRSYRRVVELFDAFADPACDRDQLAFEFRGICQSYHHASRLLREPRAATWAWQALEGLLSRAEGAAGRV